jgi:hypothetical protein
MKKALIAVGVLLLVVCGAGLVLPRKVVSERSKVISARPEHLYPYVATLSTWPEWTAWNQRRDPTFKPSYEGPTTGKGAVQRWTESESGPGSLTITDADPEKGITFHLVVERAGVSLDGSIRFEREGDGTKVTWRDELDFSGSYIGRYLGPFVDADLQERFEESLTNLKARAEERARQP